jgi:hypothetical protein
MDFLKKGINKVKDKVSQVDLEKKLNEATTNETAFANISLLNEISSRTDDSDECKIILKFCTKMLTLKPKFWKRILKDLNLIEHLVKTGSQNFVEGIKDERDKLRDLNDFSYEEEGKDKGEKSKYIYIFKLYLYYFLFYYESKRKGAIYFQFSDRFF